MTTTSTSTTYNLWDSMKTLLSLNDVTAVLVLVALLTTLFQLGVLIFYFKKNMTWMILMYSLVIFLYNVCYYQLFSSVTVVETIVVPGNPSPPA